MSDIDHWCTDNPVCPWCGHEEEFQHESYASGGMQECDKCDRLYELTVDWNPLCCTEKIFDTQHCGFGLIAEGKWEICKEYRFKSTHYDWLDFALRHWSGDKTIYHRWGTLYHTVYNNEPKSRVPAPFLEGIV